MSVALHKDFPLLLATLVEFSTPACSTAFMKKAQNTDTLFDLITLMAGKSDDDVLPIERVPAYPGEMITAHVRARPKRILVSGTMRRNSPYPPQRYHIDVTLVNAEGRVLERVAAAYKPGMCHLGCVAVCLCLTMRFGCEHCIPLLDRRFASSSMIDPSLRLLTRVGPDAAKVNGRACQSHGR